MCVFCASIPAVMALGVSAKAKQNQEQNRAEIRGEPRPRSIIPVGKATMVVVTGLVISSIVYHTHVGG
jgi:hypothetical protein